MALSRVAPGAAARGDEMVNGRGAVFLDRDGVINIAELRDGKAYAPARLSDFRIYADAPQALAALNDAGFRIVVVTNQPDVGHGRTSLEDVEAMHDLLLRSLPIERVYACYHRQDEGCDCRKPRIGLLARARDDLGIDLKRSVMVGDRWSDIEAGRRASCGTVFVDRNYAEPGPEYADATVTGIAEASDYIVCNWQADAGFRRGR